MRSAFVNHIAYLALKGDGLTSTVEPQFWEVFMLLSQRVVLASSN